MACGLVFWLLNIAIAAVCCLNFSFFSFEKGHQKKDSAWKIYCANNIHLKFSVWQNNINKRKKKKIHTCNGQHCFYFFIWLIVFMTNSMFVCCFCCCFCCCCCIFLCTSYFNLMIYTRSYRNVYSLYWVSEWTCACDDSSLVNR